MHGLHVNHFGAMVLFAVLVSVGLASLGRQTMVGRIRYAVWSLALFLIIAIGVAWLMFPFSR
ncbi:MAG: hypothetical protein WBQ34_16055 [Candidatus Acidiferrales bacterium]